MRKSYTRRDALLGVICIIVFCGLKLVSSTSKVRQDPLYNTKIKAYEYMEDCMEVVREFKDELGLSMAKEDIHKTGMIGDSYSPITTSLGSIEAKRTSANTDMAALVVELLHKAGVTKGDKIGANFSGSFPAMNLAVLSACRAMEVECIYISSIGASNFGANQIELTFLDMALKLTEKGLIESPGEAFSIGGTGDIGVEMEKEVIDSILDRLKNSGLPQLEALDYQSNLSMRQRIFESKGEISSFVNVGGHTTSLGESEDSFYFGQGLLTGKITPVTDESGLIEIYRNRGIPVIQLLNLKKLTADYELPYDPVVIPEKGTSSLYVKPSYNKALSMFFLGVAISGLLIFREKGREKN